MESHNHPSFIEPLSRCSNWSWGILRDVFTMGARPIASMNLLDLFQLKEMKTKKT